MKKNLITFIATLALAACSAQGPSPLPTPSEELEPTPAPMGDSVEDGSNGADL
ncbi:MAG: hypothetical protein O2904_00880 [bacterium]|nr:hypothetical protein [bacterium]